MSGSFDDSIRIIEDHATETGDAHLFELSQLIAIARGSEDDVLERAAMGALIRTLTRIIEEVERRAT